jgi:hypothetical protein
MKTITGFIIVFLYSFYFLSAQESHQYGPVKENYFKTWIREGNSSPRFYITDHYVGGNGVGNEVRSINFWEWTYGNIPTEGTVTSVVIKFKVSFMYTDDFHFTLHNIGYKYGTSGVTFFNECTANNQIYDTTLDMSTHYSYFTRTFSSGPVLTALNNAIQSGNYFFTLGIKLDPTYLATVPYYISGYGGGNSDQPAIDLTINYTTPNQTFQFVNKIEGTQNSGYLVIDNDKQNPVSSGDERSFYFNTTHTVRTNELPFVLNWNGTGKTEKHYRFFITNPTYVLNYSFTARPESPQLMDALFLETKPATINIRLIDDGSTGTGNIELKDPWHYYKDGQNDWYQTNEYISYSTPFELSNNSTTSYGGVCLNQRPDVEGIYYSINAPSSYFQNWSVTSGDATFQNADANETGVVFKQANTTISANYKGSRVSNSQSSYTNSSQRKFIRTPPNQTYYPNGILHLVYESMGKIWYETSWDNGATWMLENGGNPLSNRTSKNPSIALIPYGSFVAIVFQEMNTNPDLTDIRLITYNAYAHEKRYDGYVHPPDNPYVLYQLYSYNLTPTVAVSLEKQILVVWSQETQDEYTGGLYYMFGTFDPQDWQFATIDWLTTYSDELKIPSTINGSIHPTIEAFPTTNYFALAWENDYSSYSSIKYRLIVADEDYGAQFLTINDASDGDGYTFNSYPSVAAISSPNTVRMSWIGRRYCEEEEEELQKATSGGGYWQKSTIFKDPSNQWMFWSYWDGVTSTSINFSSNRYVIGWSADGTNQFTDNRSLSNVISLNISGNDMQIGNGTDSSSMYAMSYNWTSPLGNFQRSNNIGSLGKVQKTSIVTGRQGVIGKENGQFYFVIGDVFVDDKLIDFVEMADTVFFRNLATINNYLITRPFVLTDNSQFTYGVQYGVTDTALASVVLGTDKQVMFKIELIDNKTEQIIGQFDQITYHDRDVYRNNNIGYKVNTKGIGNRTVQLRLVLDENLNGYYSVAKRYGKESAVGLSKKGSSYKSISYKGSLTVKEFDLSQNYPNPFNPTTTIKYQLKDPGFTQIKVYDALGREVSTLLNQYQTSGYYSTEWDARHLSSGMYIYRLTVMGSANNKLFSQTKRMMLVK